jgi:hypothetical protein
VLGTDAAGDVEQARIGSEVVDAPVRHEHGAELEGDEAVASRGERSVRARPIGAVERAQAVRGEHDRHAAARCDGLERARVGLAIPARAGCVRDVRAGDERAPDDLLRHVEHARPLRFVEQLHVARIHVDGGREPDLGRAREQLPERAPVDPATPEDGKQHGRHAADLPLAADAPYRVSVVHVCVSAGLPSFGV